jgi:predicted signal transduction protein with EAL and GGDEF domain
LLKGLANRLRQVVREEDTIARLGGDEFVILLEGLGQSGRDAVGMAQAIAEKLRLAFEPPFNLDGHELQVTSSIGIVTYPQDGNDVDTLLRHADTAMYHAKGAGRDAAQVFERQMDEAAMSRLRFEQDLRQGLAERQFELYFQPVQAIRTGQVLGAEALLRWNHPTLGRITPSDFLPYIENSALMLRLGDWVISETCRVLAELQAAQGVEPPCCLGINISRQQLEQPDFVSRVRRTLARTGAEPHRLQFEVTETVLVRDNKAVARRMHELQQQGIRFALDDFGTGYSSLGDLRRLPIDTLKIDRSLIRDIASDSHDEAIVRAILSMTDHLGLQVVAEGVETQAQLAVLRAANCTYYQGYVGRPPIDLASYRQELEYQLSEAGAAG